jgi:hypothetical protein
MTLMLGGTMSSKDEHVFVRDLSEHALQLSFDVGELLGM